jgi:hypothetical protein
VFEESPDATGEEAFDAPDGFSFGFALGDSTGDVAACGGFAALLGYGHEIEGAVELAVAATVEAVAGLVLPGGRGDR